MTNILFGTVTRRYSEVPLHNVHESRDPSCQLMKMSRCHDTSIYLACSYQKTRWEKCPSYNICLLVETMEKEKGKLFIASLAVLQCTNT